MRKPLHPIGKTQGSKWQDPARSAYNGVIATGGTFAQAVAAANEVQANTHKVKLLDVIEDVVETVADVAETAAPIIAVAKTVAKVAKAKKKAK